MPAIARDAGGGLIALGSGGCVLRMAPIIKKSVPIPMAETNKEPLRPSVSTPKKMNIAVATTFTTPKQMT